MGMSHKTPSGVSPCTISTDALTFNDFAGVLLRARPPSRAS